MSPRFSLIMLEDGEYYMEDVAAVQHVSPAASSPTPTVATTPTPTTTTPFDERPQVRGRLHLCCKNLYFEPDAPGIPISRLPLQHIVSVRIRSSAEHAYFTVVAHRCVRIVSREPYVFDNISDAASAAAQFCFSLPYADLSTFVRQLSTLHVIERMPGKEDKRYVVTRENVLLLLRTAMHLYSYSLSFQLSIFV
jgi:hypothetical protein